MTCYAIGLLQEVAMGPDIRTYLEKIDETLAPFGGRFIIHGGSKTMLEGQADDDLIVIEFPDKECAEDWYHSDAYQRIIDYRRNNSKGAIFLIDGAETGHRATDILAA